MRIVSGFTVVALSLLFSSPMHAQGRTNASRGRSQATAVGNSRVQRAISNRQRVLDRVLGRTQGTPRANAAASTRGRIPDVGAMRRAALLRVGAGTATGRVNRELARDRARGFGKRTVARDRSHSLRRSGVPRRNAFGLERTSRPDVLSGQDGSISTARSNNGRRARNNGVSERRKRLALTQAERLLAQRLASIDHLRDVGLRNGNVKLLEKADQLEQLARQQFDRRKNGTKMDVPSIFRRERPAMRREAPGTFRVEAGSDNRSTTKNQRRE